MSETRSLRYLVAAALAVAGTFSGRPLAAQTMTLEKTDFTPGESITVRYAHPPYQANGWVGIFRAAAPHGDGRASDAHDLAYDYLGNVQSGVMIFTAPAPADRYELRMFTAVYGDEALVVPFTVGMGTSATAVVSGAAGGGPSRLPALPEADRRRILDALRWSGKGEPWVWAGYPGDAFEIEIRGEPSAQMSLVAGCEAGCSIQTAVADLRGETRAESAPGGRVEGWYSMPREGVARVRVGIADCPYDRCAFFVDGLGSAGVNTGLEGLAAEPTDYTGLWNTSYGDIDLRGTATLTGSYNGSSRVHLTATGAGLEGYWTQPTSGERCNREVEGSFYWGRLVLTRRPDGSLAGLWGYCDGQPASSWDFRR